MLLILPQRRSMSVGRGSLFAKYFRLNRWYVFSKTVGRGIVVTQAHRQGLRAKLQIQETRGWFGLGGKGRRGLNRFLYVLPSENRNQLRVLSNVFVSSLFGPHPPEQNTHNLLVDTCCHNQKF